jgi:hypothetical protein
LLSEEDAGPQAKDKETVGTDKKSFQNVMAIGFLRLKGSIVIVWSRDRGS